MKKWEKILVACGVAVIAVEVALILIYKIPIYFPYKRLTGRFSSKRCLDIRK